MRVYVPFTNLQLATQVVLTGYDHQLIKMTADDCYPKYLQTRWREREPFINCEHDVVFWHGALEQLERCDKPWCAFGMLGEPKPFYNGPAPTLCLARFTTDFIDMYPAMWIDFLKEPDVEGWPKWRYCDNWLMNYVDARGGERCHQHHPPITNSPIIQKSVQIGGTGATASQSLDSITE